MRRIFAVTSNTNAKKKLKEGRGGSAVLRRGCDLNRIQVLESPVVCPFPKGDLSSGATAVAEGSHHEKISPPSM